MNTLILALLLVVTAAAFNSGNGGGRFDSLSSWSLEEGGRFRPPSRPRPPGQPRPPGIPRPPRPPGRPRLLSTGCPTGWMRFERPNGVWCVMVGHSTTANGFMSQAEAEAVCVRHGAVLTGIQNDKYSCGKRGTPEGMNIFLHFKNL